MGFKASLLVGLVAIVSVYWISKRLNSIDVNEYYKGRRIVITGASKGIGKELAIQLAGLGAELFITARSGDLLESTADQCRSVGDNVTVHTLVNDVGKKEECQILASEAIKKMGGIDMLILNAAFSPRPSFITEIDDLDAAFTSVFRVNLFQSVNLVQYLLPNLIESKGHIVAVSSGASLLGMPQVAAYSSSKHALNGFFKSLRQEFTIKSIPVDITIMPLPYVLTDKAVDNWRPIGSGGGITTEACAEDMIQKMPSRKSWIYSDWSSYIIGLLGAITPDFSEYCVRMYLSQTSLLFSSNSDK